MKKIIFALFVFSSLKVNAQREDTIPKFWDKNYPFASDTIEKITSDFILAQFKKSKNSFHDTIFSNDTLKLFAVSNNRIGEYFSDLYCSKFGKKIIYIGTMRIFSGIGNVRTAYYHNGVFSFLNDEMVWRVYQLENGVFKRKIQLFSNDKNLDKNRTNLFEPFAFDVYYQKKDFPIRYRWALNGKYLVRGNMEFYQTEDIPLTDGEISLEIK